MAAIEKHQGHDAEKSHELHQKLMSITDITGSFIIGTGAVIVEGTSGTKTDFVIGDKRISQKTPSGRNTQVWLPTKKTLFIHVPGLASAKTQILELIGTPLDSKKTTEIADFDAAIDAFNAATIDRTLLNKMFLQVDKEEPVQYISWVKKSKGGGGLTLIDAKKYVDYLQQNAIWIKRDTTLWLINKDDVTMPPRKMRKYAHFQRKGSGQKDTPMFHMYSTWPEDAVLHHDPKFVISGI